MRKTPSKKELVLDFQQVIRKNPGTAITERIYRAQGKFHANEWQKVFPNFGAFRAAALADRVRLNVKGY